jgi:hypothetical protein
MPRTALRVALGTVLLSLACGLACREAPVAQKKAPEPGQEPLETEVIADTYYCVDDRGRAVSGYDVTTYYDHERALLGRDAFTTHWGGAHWYFTSAENLNRFKADPDRYAPAIGGYCSYGVLLAKKLEPDSKIFAVVDGQLYLFLDEDVKVKFLRDQKNNLAKVNKNWPQLSNSLL